MKLGKVRVGERFVFDDRGGVFQRISWEKARCIYGSNFGTEIDINPDISVYAIFDKDKGMRFNKRDAETDNQVSATATVPVQIPVPVPETVGPETWTQAVKTTTTPIEGVVRVVFIDGEDKILHEIPAASAVQVSAFLRADFIRIRMPDGNIKTFYVTDVGFDTTEQTLGMSVEERPE